MRISARAVEHLAYKDVFHRHPSRSRSVNARRFAEMFGTDSTIAAAVWNRAARKHLLPRGFKLKHLLWTLTFLKVYSTEGVRSDQCSADEKTMRKWIGKGLLVLSELNLVRCIHEWRALIKTLVLLSLMNFYCSICTDKVGEEIHER